MRIALLLTLLALSACSTAQPVPGQARRDPDLNNAQAACIKNGHTYGSYEFNVCYQNRPEVQRNERERRLNGMSILSSNRSPYSSNRSYPVE